MERAPHRPKRDVSLVPFGAGGIDLVRTWVDDRLRSLTLAFAGVVGACGALCLAAVGRVRAMEWISGSDLAFFHQSIWSASRGGGLAQTVLPFENVSLVNSQHFSLVRSAVTPIYALAPGLATLVAVQAAVIGLSAILVWYLSREEGGDGWSSAALFVFHPMTVVLACTDFRPIVFALPGVLLAALGIARKRVWIAVLGGVLTLAAREEGSLLLAALAPYALYRGGWKLVLAVVGVAAAGPFLVDAVLGKPSHFIGVPQLYVLGWPTGKEVVFLAACLAPAVLAWRGHVLLAPAILLWLPLLFLPLMEPSSPNALGAHYLAFAYPPLMAGLVLGLAGTGPRRQLVALGLTVLVAAPWWFQAAGWMGASLGRRSAEVVDLQALLEPLAATDQPVLAAREVAPLLARRDRLYVTGEVDAGLDDWFGLALVRRGDLWEDLLVQRGFVECGGNADWRRWCGPGAVLAPSEVSPPGGSER